ncbi:MAG: hypothetical protein AAGB24_13220 [Bacteroidota bacterium]
MKFKLFSLVPLFLVPFLHAQTAKDHDSALKQVIETFRVSIIEHTDVDKFSDLFLHDSVTWAAIITGETKKRVLKKRPDFTFLATDHKSFFEKLKEGSEEKFYDVKIDVRDEFATVSFDYSFSVNAKIKNWGTEYWSLVLVNNTWKITSVTWSQHLEQFEKCPFTSENLFELN